jgi:toxin-antitoxin system PIN domain toxin
MIAVDTNILVYAHREDSPWHTSAFKRIAELAEGRALWAIPWPCIHEFLAIVTHPRIYIPPTTLAQALDQIEAWLESPSVSVLSETEGYWPELRAMVEAGKASGGQIHEARVAALCRLHGVRELWSAARDFGRFAGMRVMNPLIGE